MCRICRSPVRGSKAVTIPRPLLGTLVFADGQRVPIDRPIRIGRVPTLSGTVAGEVPLLVTLASSGRGISRNHADIRLNGWDVVLTDLNSSNGTVVSLPGGSVVRLRADDPVTISPGTSVSLGDETSFLFDAAP